MSIITLYSIVKDLSKICCHRGSYKITVIGFNRFLIRPHIYLNNANACASNRLLLIYNIIIIMLADKLIKCENCSQSNSLHAYITNKRKGTCGMYARYVNWKRLIDCHKSFSRIIRTWSYTHNKFYFFIFAYRTMVVQIDLAYWISVFNHPRFGFFELLIRAPGGIRSESGKRYKKNSCCSARASPHGENTPSQ